jgi:hypothetical protein
MQDVEKKLPCAMAGGDEKSLQVLCDKKLERRHVKTLKDSTTVV